MQGIDIALSKLKNGDWVHIFPEGSRSRDGGKTIGAIRRGIGRYLSGKALKGCYLASVVFSMCNFFFEDGYHSG
jgi:1-acyl-sn-glycerol-3-phosphate acyltransferase